jgi:glycosyltransferase involved in cell wall biosynthesis
MGKDLIGERYGRFYEIAVALAACGNDIAVVAADYHSRVQQIEDMNSDGVRWITVPWRSLRAGGPIRWWSCLNRNVSEVAPEAVVGCGDALQVIAGNILAKHTDVPFVADLYDNFDSYGLTKIPGISSRFRQAVEEADAVTCVSGPLADLVRRWRRNVGSVFVIGNAIPEDLFYPIEKVSARSRLGLPLERTLIGIGGALDSSRDMETVYAAISALRVECPNAELVLAGRGDDVGLSSRPGVTCLGMLDYQKMPIFFSALDVGVIPNRDATFARYCFPQKFYEMAACGIPVVAAEVGEISQVLGQCKNCLYRPGDVQGLAQALLNQILAPDKPDIAIPTWGQRAFLFNQLLQAVSANA